MPIVSGGGGGGTFNGGTITAPLVVDPSATNVDALTVVGDTGGTDYAFRVTDAAANDLFRVREDGLLRVLPVDGGSLVFTNSGLVSTASGTSQSLVGKGNMQVKNNAGDTQWLELGLADGCLLAVFNLAGDAYGFRVTSAGAPITSANAAPADGVLNAGDCALWFDSTNGAPKLMVKGKQANGTVVTAAIALA